MEELISNNINGELFKSFFNSRLLLLTVLYDISETILECIYHKSHCQINLI